MARLWYVFTFCYRIILFCYLSIYDPAISSFVEPRTAAFTNFTSDCSNTIAVSQFNVSGVFNQGWNFYTLGWKTGSTVFFQALGFRDTHTNRSAGNGTVINVGFIGIYQVVGTSSLSNGRDFFISSGYDYPQDISYRSYGCTCRPVSE